MRMPLTPKALSFLAASAPRAGSGGGLVTGKLSAPRAQASFEQTVTVGGAALGVDQELLWLAHERGSGGAKESSSSATTSGCASTREAPRSRRGRAHDVTLYAVSADGDAPELIPVECVLGPKWIVTAYRGRSRCSRSFSSALKGEVKSGARHTLVRRNDYRLDRRQLSPRLGRRRERAGGAGREGHDQYPQRSC